MKDILPLSYSLSGEIIAVGQRISSLRVEAWNGGRSSTRFVDCGATDIDGRFEMALEPGYLDTFFPDGEVPEIFFRVFDGNRLLADTRDSATWRPNGRTAHIRIVVDTRNLPEDNADPAPSVVQGLVADAVDGPLATVSVQAADRVLRDGVLTDVQVGSAVTDDRGRYRIEYMPAAGKVKADLTVKALDQSGAEIVHSEVWCHAPPFATVDLTVGAESWPGPAERDKVTTQLGDVDVAGIDDDVAEFLACSRGVAEEQLDRLRATARLARDYRVSSELLYALGSQGMPVDLRSLLAAEPGQARDAVTRATERNTVSKRIRPTLESDLEALRSAVVGHAMQRTDDDRRPSLGDILATGQTDRAVHQTFLDRFVARQGTIEEFWADLVRQPPFDRPEVVADLQLSLQLTLLTQGNLPLLRHLSARRADGRLRALPDLTSLSRDDWRRLLVEAAAGEDLPIPPDIPGDTTEARTERYLDSLLEPLNDAFPWRYLRQGIARSPEVDVALVRELHRANDDLDPREPLPDEPQWGSIGPADRERGRAAWAQFRAEARSFPEFAARDALGAQGPTTLVNPIRVGVDRLFINLDDPDLGSTNLDDTITGRGDAAFAGIPVEYRQAVVRQAKTYQRVYRVAPRALHVDALLGAGFHSALAIALSSKKLLIRDLGDSLGGEAGVDEAHQRAKHHAGSAQLAMTAIKQAYLDINPWVIVGNDSDDQPAPIEGGPDLESLFGQQALCECSHCRSVYSPTAYLVDLLQFLGPKARGHLLARRPDLAHLLLSCENTNTTIPYIDLVNEILEWSVANPADDLPAYDTDGASADELRAVPQHVVDAAYDTLHEAVYPATLPFHRPLALTRAYLGHLGVSREELLELFRPGADAWDAARVAESLGMSSREYQIITGTLLNPLPLHQYYGDLDPTTWKQDIAKAPVFLRQTGLVFTDLVALVETWFVNRHQSVPAQRIALDAPGECDIESTTITHLDDDGDVALDRIHRFLRLWRRLGWSMTELDRALFTLGANELDATALRKLAQLRLLMAELKLPLTEALALLGPIDTWGRDSHYLKLFRSRAVAKLEDSAAFALAYPFVNDPGDPDAPPDPDIKDPALPFELADVTNPLGSDPHTAVVLAALRLTEPDLDLIRGHAGITADAPLNLVLLSTLYRYAVLGRRLRLKVADLVSLLRLTVLDPFQSQEPAGTLDFVGAVARVQRSGMRVETLDYLYRHAVRPTQGPVPVATEVTALLLGIRSASRQLRDDLVDRDDPTGEDLRAKLGLAFEPEVVDRAMAVVLGDASGMPDEPAAFLAEHFAAFDTAQEAASILLQPLPLTDGQRLANVTWVRGKVLPWLRLTLARGVVVSTVADAVGLSPTLVRDLLEVHLSARVVANGRAIDDFLALADVEPVPDGTDVVLPAGYAVAYELIHKAALVIDGLDLTEAETEHLLAHPERFGGFTLDGLPLEPVDDSAAAALFAGWQRAADLAGLRAELPDGDRSLVDVFETAVPQGEDPVDHLLGGLAEVTGWDLLQLTALASSLGLTDEDFRTEAQLLVLRDRLGVAHRVGLAIDVLSNWATTEPDVTRAAAVVQTVKARYEPDRWLDVARGLNDGLREAQRSALVDYLVPRMHDQGVDNANQLLEYFLVDPGMQSCMLTSRVRLALSSVQLFVQRCLLNLETGIDPDDIDGDRWTENSIYRVWEANRKVFLYPENFTEEGLQAKTPFFRQLETELLQNELTDEYVDQAYLNYLRRLDEVARLDVRAMHWQREKSAGIDRLHVVARTPSAPYRYFYRRFENSREWTPWEPVDLDIGDAPHLVLVVHNRRLQLLWSSFTQKPSAAQFPTDSDSPPPLLVVWEVQIGWSEHRQGQWSPRQLSKAAIWPADGFYEDGDLPTAGRFLAHVHHDGDRMKMHFARDLDQSQIYQRRVRLGVLFQRDGATAAFTVAAKKVAGYKPTEWWVVMPANGEIAGMAIDFEDQLWLHSKGLSLKHILDELPTKARMVRSNLTDDLPTPGYYPFFLAQGARTYFAYPVAATPDPVRAQVSWAGSSPGTIVSIGDFLVDSVPVAAADELMTFDHAESIGAQQVQTIGTKTYGEGLQDLYANPMTAQVAIMKQELRFMTFWHPHVSELIRALNRDGIPGLLTLKNQRLTLDGPGQSTDNTLFRQTYDPTDNVTRPRPRADVDFEPDGAYSLYNWELFFHVPMLIATRLRQEGRYAEARRWLHYVFDPTTDEGGETPRRFWRFKPFNDNDEYARVQELLELLAYTGSDPALLARKKQVADQVADWLAHPFDPHRIARLRLVAYQRHVVMRYIDVLVEGADDLYRRDTIESINEATQLYVMAANLLGPRPQHVPARAGVAPKTYAQLQAEGLDPLSNAAVALENVLFPFAPSSDGQSGDASGGDASSILGLGQTLYFCAPNNDQLLQYWDQVEDRLFKIRHCLNIEGVARQLALFDPPIDPAALVRAAASGADLGSVLGDLFAPLPPYRFSYLLAKAGELTAEVKSLGAQLLSALQNRDAEKLAHVRALQEQAVLAAVRTVKQQQIDDAESAKAALEKSKAVTEERHAFYAAIERINAKEEAQLDRLGDSQTRSEQASFMHTVAAGIRAAAPKITAGTSGSFGSPVLTMTWDGDNWAAGAEGVAHVAGWMAGYESYKANMASTQAGHQRRWDDWKLQERLAALEIAQIEQQISEAELRRQIAETELANHELQMAHAAESEEILRRKFTNEELYGWMMSQVSALYFQAYKLAYDMAKRAERAYRFERGLEKSNFVTFGYWDGLRKGLLAGERLSLDLKRLDAAYVEQNRRDYELSLRVPLSQWDPQALVQLKTSGTCEVDLTEVLYDANCPGHYHRRFKALGLTAACVTGPYANVNATVTMLGNRIRTKSTVAGPYREQPPDVENRFLYDFAANSRIATSHGNDDTGVRELSFRDERYLPFEGAGAICRLRIDLPQHSNGWDLSTLSDLVLTVRYDAREGGDLLRAAAMASLEESLGLAPEEDGAHHPPLRRLFSARHELSDAWHRFLHPQDDTAPQELAFELTREHYPYLLRSRTLEVVGVDLFLVPKDGAAQPVPSGGMPLTLTLPDDETVGLVLTPPAGGDPIPLAHADSPVAFTTEQTTGTWRLTVPLDGDQPALPPGVVDDLLVVLTYHVTG